MKKLLFSLEKKYIILSCIIFVVVFALAMLLRQAESTMIRIADAALVGAIALLAWGLLTLVHHLGTFDLFRYTFKRIASKDKDFSNKSFKDGYEAFLKLKESKPRYEPLLIGSVILLIAVVASFALV